MTAQSIPGANLPVWGAYLRMLDRAPVRTKCITSCILFVLSQLCSQYITLNRIANKGKVRDFGIWGLLMPVAAHHWQNFMVYRGPQRMFIKIPFDHICYRVPIMFVFSIYMKLM